MVQLKKYYIKPLKKSKEKLMEESYVTKNLGLDSIHGEISMETCSGKNSKESNNGFHTKTLTGGFNFVIFNLD